VLFGEVITIVPSDRKTRSAPVSTCSEAAIRQTLLTKAAGVAGAGRTAGAAISSLAGATSSVEGAPAEQPTETQARITAPIPFVNMVDDSWRASLCHRQAEVKGAMS